MRGRERWVILEARKGTIASIPIQRVGVRKVRSLGTWIELVGQLAEDTRLRAHRHHRGTVSVHEVNLQPRSHGLDRIIQKFLEGHKELLELIDHCPGKRSVHRHGRDVTHLKSRPVQDSVRIGDRQLGLGVRDGGVSEQADRFVRGN
jgi:hypothetical protein